MAVTVTALYENMPTAQTVVDELVEAGFDRKQVSVAAQDAHDTGLLHTGSRDEAVTAITHDTEVGAVVGGIGGLAVGLAALAIPGIGPFVAAGPIASALAGLGVGAATGGLLGAMHDVGVSTEQAEYYAEGMREGHVLVTIQAPDARAEEAQEIVNRYDPVDKENENPAQPRSEPSAAATAKQEAPEQTDLGPTVV
ncbi:MAG: general stress protein [Caldilineaceae bacterium]